MHVLGTRAYPGLAYPCGALWIMGFSKRIALQGLQQEASLAHLTTVTHTTGATEAKPCLLFVCF